VQRALRIAELAPAGGTTRGTLKDRVWAAGRLLQRTARSRRVTALLDGEATSGHAIFRTRFAGIEVDSGRGVFLPVAFSEALLEAGRERIAGKRDPLVIDVGTGCGAVALALAAARPDSAVHAVEVSSRALRWARRNARRLDAHNVDFHHGSLLDPIPGALRDRVDLILTNVPYAPPAYRRASWDDMPGTIGGEDPDGLGLQRRLAGAARPLLAPGAWLVAQIAAEQSDAYRAELARGGYVDVEVVATSAGDCVVAARARP